MGKASLKKNGGIVGGDRKPIKDFQPLHARVSGHRHGVSITAE